MSFPVTNQRRTTKVLCRFCRAALDHIFIDLGIPSYVKHILLPMATCFSILSGELPVLGIGPAANVARVARQLCYGHSRPQPEEQALTSWCLKTTREEKAGGPCQVRDKLCRIHERMGHDLGQVNTSGQSILAALITCLCDGRQMVTIAAGHDILTFGL